MAADLTLSGFEAVLYEHPQFAEGIEKVLTSGKIELQGVKHEGVASLKKVTLDMSEALADAELINVVIPALGHELFFDELIPQLEDGQTIVVWAGDFGSLRLAKLVKDRRPELEVSIAEANTIPYGTRIAEPGVVELLLTAPKVGVAALPTSDTAGLIEALEPMWPELVPMDNVLAAALANPNPVCHPPGSILNTGRIQYSDGDFYMYGEGITEAVARVIRGVFNETVALAEALGVEVFQYEDRDFRRKTSIMGTAFQAPFDTVGVIGDIIGPKSVHDRYITEDLPYGLVPMSQLGDKLGVDTPLIDSFVDLGSVICKEDYWKTGRTLDTLGIADLDREELLALAGGE
jgi:opine dehydrogenase